MTVAVTKAGWIRISIITVVGILLIVFIPESKQHHNMRLAQVHADRLNPVLSADARFADVKLGPWTGDDGALMVSGLVQSEKEKEALMDIVVASKPPVNVVYMVFTSDQTIPVRSSAK